MCSYVLGMVLFIGNKLFISQEYTNVGIKREVENKSKTYLHIYKNLTCLQVKNTYTYIHGK